MLLLCLYAPFAVTQTLFLTTRNRQEVRATLGPRGAPCLVEMVSTFVFAKIASIEPP